MSEPLIYEASVYERTVSYRNFKGEVKTTTLYFALDPLHLMTVIADVPTKKSRSGNPALKNQTAEISDEAQLKFIRNLACKAAGAPSDDGENWTPWVDFEETLVGKAFLTKLASSDGDRREFSEKVILDPFRAFVQYAVADPTNSPKEVQEFQVMMAEMENLFKMPDAKAETLEQKRARLQAEMDQLQGSPEAEQV